MSKKTWQEKLHEKNDLPKVVKLDTKAAQRWGGETMYIASPLIIDEVMKSVPKGKLFTTNEIRQSLAKKNKTAITCPLTTGIFVWIAANAAEEAKAAGEKNITPYWRTLRSGGELNPKYPGGVGNQQRLLEHEGFTIIPGKGKKLPQVKDYEKYVMEI